MTNIMQLLNMMGKKVMPIDINIYDKRRIQN